MKKFILAASVVALFATGAQAQVESSYRPVGGSRTFEFSLAPLGANPVGLPGGSLKFRQFSSQTSAIRAGIFLGYMGETSNSIAFDSNGDEVELSDRMSEIGIAVQVGIEKHFTGTERLSPYVAGTVNIGYTGTSSTTEFLAGTDVFENKTTQPILNFGLNGLLGFDYYVAEKLFIGAEGGIGLGINIEGTSTASSDAPGATDVETPGGSAINFGPGVQGTLRLGFVF